MQRALRTLINRVQISYEDGMVWVYVGGISSGFTSGKCGGLERGKKRDTEGREREKERERRK